MLPVELFDFSLEKPLILDLAAAPGGKTTHLSGRTGDLGLIIANDASASRLPGLRAVLQSSTTIHGAVTNFPGEFFGSWFPNTFDRVLVDAPCSMENLRPSPGHPQRKVSLRERRSLAHRQVNLLTSALRAARPGGQIVYSTCTLAPEEDEAVIDELLRLNPGMVEVENVTDFVGKLSPGLASYKDQVFNPATSRTVRIWPHVFGSSGFFATLLTKTKETQGLPTDPPERPISKTRYQPLSSSEQTNLVRLLDEDYGFDLAAFLEMQQLSVWHGDSFFYFFPETYFSHFGQLPFFALGLPFGRQNQDNFSLTREFTLRFRKDLNLSKTISSTDLRQ